MTEALEKIMRFGRARKGRIAACDNVALKIAQGMEVVIVGAASLEDLGYSRAAVQRQCWSKGRQARHESPGPLIGVADYDRQWGWRITPEFIRLYAGNRLRLYWTPEQLDRLFTVFETRRMMPEDVLRWLEGL